MCESDTLTMLVSISSITAAAMTVLHNRNKRAGDMGESCHYTVRYNYG
jgi:hypothetical protein